jgi:hypothetical protein
MPIDRPDVAAMLADRSRYERQIERLHQRHLLSSRLYELRQQDVSLASIVMHRARVARLLARDVAGGRYRLEPGELRAIWARGKRREVFSCRLTDLLVHGVVADIVREATSPLLSEQVYSYRAGVSWTLPISRFAAWLRAASKAQGTPLRRGVYVLRSDVDSYTDSIPIGRSSPLWPMLRTALGTPLHPLVTQAIRTELRLPGGALASRVRGLPMGQPIASVIANVYLSGLDRMLGGIDGGFYARYGDDFLFGHPDPEVTRTAAERATDVLAGLGLTVNERKRRTIHLTRPGRPGTWPGAVDAPFVPFLGTRVFADGTIGLDGPKVRRLLTEVDQRVRSTVRSMRGADRDEIGRAACAVVNRALDPGSVLTQQRSALLVRRVVTSREQLTQLDHRIALIVAEAVTGRSGPRAFREVRYRTLRRDWRLMSLVAARNAARERA